MYKISNVRLLLLIIGWTISEVICEPNATTTCTKCPVNLPCVPLRDDYVNVPGIGAYKLHTVAANWDTARNLCEQEGAYLAVLNFITEAEEISKIFTNGGTISGTNNQDYALVGFHDQFKEGEYVTIFSQTLPNAGYDLFPPGEPNNLNGVENCGSITKTGLLNDISCTKMYAFICELVLCNSCGSS